MPRDSQTQEPTMTARLLALHAGYRLQTRRDGNHRTRRKFRFRGRHARRADRRDAAIYIND